MRRFALAALTLVPLLTAAAPPTSEITVTVEGLRSDRGLVRACLTALPSAFPDCSSDPAARRLSLPAGEAGKLVFASIPPGRYAISLLHDENGNGRADMALMLPREGFGFSRNPRISFGPPRFRSAAFAVEGTAVRQEIRMRYLL
jgi:uncharacterized protein (DUF2141 family)